MGLDFFISISSLIAGIALGLTLAVHNHKRLRETHEERMRIYRIRKKRKNEALRRFLTTHYPERMAEIQMMDVSPTPNQNSREFEGDRFIDGP